MATDIKSTHPLNDPKGLTTKVSPLSDGYIPYHVDDKTGFANSSFTDAALVLSLEGKKTKHGWNTQTLNSATQLTIAKPVANWIFTLNCGATFEYYVEGVEVIITGTKTYDFGTTPTQTLHYLFFDDATGTIKHRDTMWNLYTEVPIASCFFNGTTWAIQEERHFDSRDRSWHVWAHTTIGARYGSGFNLTAPNIGSNITVNVSGGTLYDEDITVNTSAATAVRIWYKTSATAWSFVDPATTPYDGSIKYTDAGYNQVDVTAAKYINQWYYCTTDTTQKIWVVREFVAQAYTTIAAARAIAPPNLNGSTYSFAGNAELKLLYRIIWKGDDTVQEVTDYRLSSPVPGGGSSATSAAAVSYTPTSPETFVTVQGALDNRTTKNVSDYTGSSKQWSYAGALADTATIPSIPTVTANYPVHGFIHCAHASTGVISESAEFEYGSDGHVYLIRGTANIEANGATAGKISIGAAAHANPVVVKNNLGGGVSVNVMLNLWYG